MTTDDRVPGINCTVAHPARRYDYWLGGKDNFAADRESGDAIEAVYPHIRTAVVENRQFLRRVVQYLVKEAGIRQFLDVGTGLPTVDNTHEVAQAINPAARIVYVDNDLLVLSHARALLTSHPAGRTAYIDADLREPAKILTDPGFVDVLDLREPVALLLVAVLHFVPDDEQAYSAVNTLMDALPSGSYLAASHATHDLLPTDVAETFSTKQVTGTGDFTGRSRAQFLRFFDGLNLIAPGVEVVSQWRPETDDPPPPGYVSVYGSVGLKP
jgi:S-adenosyl methyltransferase